jgi:type I site-specific restriction endonuclease
MRGGEANKADYLLYYKPNITLAVIEAKDSLIESNTFRLGKDHLRGTEITVIVDT